MYLFIVGARLAFYNSLWVEPLVLFDDKDFWRQSLAAAKSHAERRLDDNVEPALGRVKEILSVEEICDRVAAAVASVLGYLPHLFGVASSLYRFWLVRRLRFWKLVRLHPVVLGPLCLVRQHLESGVYLLDHFLCKRRSISIRVVLASKLPVGVPDLLVCGLF